MPLSPVVSPARSCPASRPTRRSLLRRLAPTALAALAAPGLLPALLGALTPRELRAESQPTDDPSGQTVDTEQGIVFLTGSAGAAGAAGATGTGSAGLAYELGVRFTGTYEQTVTLYQWADAPEDANAANAGNGGNGGNPPAGACWKRRTFLNSYYQGTAATVSFELAAGQKFLIVAYHKDGEPPANDHGWEQSRMDHGDVSKVTEKRPYPLVEAVFKHEKGSTLIWLRPDMQARPTPRPGALTRPASTTQPTTQPAKDS